MSVIRLKKTTLKSHSFGSRTIDTDHTVCV